MPGLPPSPITRTRTSAASTRTASLALSLTSRWASSTDLIYVPMPPVHSKSTAHRMARISSGGVNSRIESASLERPASGGEDRNGLGGAVPHSPARADEGGVVVRPGRTGQ